MRGVIFKLNSKGIQQLLKSPGVQADLERRARAIADAANADAGLDDDFAIDVDIGKNRARAVVVTETAEAMVAEATNRSLTRAIDAGR